MEEMNIYQALHYIQQELKAPKGQYNKFGGYSYRSAEDILAALKPLLNATGTVLVCEERMVDGGHGSYMEVTATLIDMGNPEQKVSANGLAREAEDQKGMTAPQITGSAHSYAKKLALGNLFMIDDTPDDDTINTHGKTPENAPKSPYTGQNGTPRLDNTKTILELVKSQKAEKLMPVIIRNSFNKNEFKELTDNEVESLKNNLMPLIEKARKGNW